MPSCVEVDKSAPSDDNFYSSAETWTFTTPQRENTLQRATFGGFSDYDKASSTNIDGTATDVIFNRAVQNKAGLPRGVALIALLDGFRAYMSLSYGGYWFCHSSCDGCNGPTRTDCSACQAWATLAGSSVHASLTNGCYCPTGDGNTGGTACDANACHSSCLNCAGTTANDCLQCSSGFNPSTPGTFPTACERDSICHRACQTCSGSRSDQCLTCKDFSPNGKLTLQNGECRCPAGKYLLDNEDNCENCHSSCSSCTGPGADQCIICSNNQAIAIKAAGATAGTCFACADPANSGTAQ